MEKKTSHKLLAEKIEKLANDFENGTNQNPLAEHAATLWAKFCGARNKLKQNEGRAQFIGLYEGGRRVMAKIVKTKYGEAWLLDDSETELLDANGGKPWVNAGATYGRRAALGLTERPEIAPASVCLAGGNQGLTHIYIRTFRTGCPWGTDAELVEEKS